LQILLPIFPSESTQINNVLSFVKREETVWYFHGCMPVFSHGEQDYRSFNMYTSQLVVVGQCKQVDIIKAFGVSAISVKRHVKKFREGGPGIFFQQRSVRKATVLTREVLKLAQEMLNEGKSRHKVSEDLCIKPDTFYRAIHSGQLVELKKKLDAKVSAV
jgi:transposase